MGRFGRTMPGRLNHIAPVSVMARVHFPETEAFEAFFGCRIEAGAFDRLVVQFHCQRHIESVNNP